MSTKTKNDCTASKLLMIRPHSFGYNEETSSSNAFQMSNVNLDAHDISQIAVREFDDLIHVLRNHEIEVIVYEDTDHPHTPDAVFPNNWISFHEDGTMILYPMQAKNRRLERRKDIIDFMQATYHFKSILDLSHYESKGKFLEGTGSIVFDHEHKIAYAALSIRTDKDVFLECCDLLGYQPIAFRAYHENGLPVYHTNVLMHINPFVSSICLDMIYPDDRSIVLDALSRSRHTPIVLSEQQVNNFAGNMLVVLNTVGIPFLIGSKKGFASLTKEQVKQIPIDIIQFDIPIIESIGGGSARCMLAEIHTSHFI